MGRAQGVTADPGPEPQSARTRCPNARLVRGQVCQRHPAPWQLNALQIHDEEFEPSLGSDLEDSKDAMGLPLHLHLVGG